MQPLTTTPAGAPIQMGSQNTPLAGEPGPTRACPPEDDSGFYRVPLECTHSITFATFCWSKSLARLGHTRGHHTGHGQQRQKARGSAPGLAGIGSWSSRAALQDNESTLGLSCPPIWEHFPGKVPALGVSAGGVSESHSMGFLFRSRRHRRQIWAQKWRRRQDLART